MYLVKLNGEQIIFDKDYYIHIDRDNYTHFPSKYEAQKHIDLHLIVMSEWIGENNFERYIRESVFTIEEVL